MRYSCRQAFSIRNLTFIGLILSILSICSSIFTITYFSVQLSKLSQYDYIYDYHDATCVPVDYQIKQIYCDPDDTPNWLITYTLNNGNSIMSNPFAINENKNILLWTNYTCMCRNNVKGDLQVGCTYWTYCLFDSEFVGYMKRDNRRYYITYVSFIGASSLSLALTLITIPLSIKTLKNMRKENYVELF
jgi:hypothetical protein